MRTSRRGAMGHLCPSLRSRLAILVYQGSDPTPPYQALVIGQSAMLFFGFAPWGQSTLFGPRPGPASEGPPPLTASILRASTPSLGQHRGKQFADQARPATPLAARRLQLRGQRRRLGGVLGAGELSHRRARVACAWASGVTCSL